MYRLSLGLICKNEIRNLPELLESVRDCFDAVFVTDTGSTDGTRELLANWERSGSPANRPLFVSDFEWCDDFAAARNFNYSQAAARSEYVMWLDADDSLVNREAFIEWRDELLETADQWLSTYDYGDAGDGRNRCMFLRERVVRTAFGFEWRYPIHEGLVPKSLAVPPVTLYATPWHVRHRRNEIDAAQDKSRNLRIFEKLKAQGKPFDARLLFYYGKELFENDKPMDAFPVLLDAASHEKTEPHDRILSIQYACLAAARCNQPERAIQLAFQGLQLAPTRAEFHVICADCYMAQGRPIEALPHYAAAKACAAPPADARVQSPIFTHRDAYTFYPRFQLARCYAQLGRLKDARAEIESVRALGEHPETEAYLAEIVRMETALQRAALTEPKGHTPVDEIVITCLPGGFYEWDDSSLETRGIGGSESAVVYLARALAALGQRVRVFGNLPAPKEFCGGRVTYHPAQESADYLGKFLPKAHIAWRHTTRLSPAPSYVWCHDLGVPGLENVGAYDQVLGLSKFHAAWLNLMCGVPKDKIRIVSNAIDRTLWEDARKDFEMGPERKPIVVWSSSPDRGLLNLLAVMDEVVREKDDAEVHVFYGFENMRKVGAGAFADQILSECLRRPYVKVRGNLTKRELAKAFLQAKAWVYPTNFLETYCITAVEAMAAGLNVVARAYGALPERFASLPARLISGEPKDGPVFQEYVEATLRALTTENTLVPLSSLPSWDDVARDWVTWLPTKR